MSINIYVCRVAFYPGQRLSESTDTKDRLKDDSLAYLNAGCLKSDCVDGFRVVVVVVVIVSDVFLTKLLLAASQAIRAVLKRVVRTF